MKFKKEHYIHDYLCVKGILSYKNLINILLETSNDQSIIKKTSTEDLFIMNKTWMIYKWFTELSRPVKIGEKITVETWASGFDKLSAFREFRVFDERKNLIFKGSVIFLVIDLKTLKPIRINEEISGKYEIINEKNFDKIDRIKKSREELLEKKFKIRRSDIDLNGHVNNAVYIDWIEESLDNNIFNNFFIEKLNLIYLKEIRGFEFATVKYDEERNYFEIFTDKVNARAEISLKRRENQI